MIINNELEYRKILKKIGGGDPMGMYMNPKQIQFLTAPQIDKTFVGGIGSGKTTVMGAEIINDILAMPQSHGAVVGNTYKQIITNFLPSLMAAFERLGLIEGKHYLVGKTPKPGWKKAHMASKNYEHSIVFCNGSQLSFMAADRKDMNRGGSYQWIKIDEAGLIKEDVYKTILSGRLRGCREYFGKSKRYRSISRVTSMPFLASGMWVLKAEEFQLGNPDKFFYLESTTMDNILVLGEEYIEDLKAIMDPLTFSREVENLRFTNLANGFYPQLNERHLYDGFEYDETNITNIFGTKFIDSDTDPWAPLSLSIDFGANFNCMSVWQYHEKQHEERCVNKFYVNKPLQLDDMVDLCCEYYRYKLSKDVDIWGDRNGHKSEVNDNRKLFEQVMDRLKLKDFNPVLKHDGWENPHHKAKYEFINSMLRETDPELPKVRYSKSKALHVYQSMMNAPVTDDFKKDKSQEKKLGNDPNRVLATDLSDTNDYYLYPRWHPDYRYANKVLGAVYGA